MAIPVEDFLETRNAVFAELRGELQPLDFPCGEALDRDALAPEHDLLVVEEDRLAVPSLPQVELDGVGAEALRPVEAV